MLDPKTEKEFQKWNKKPPTSKDHGTEDEIADKMERLMPETWRQEGNLLIGETKVGKLVQRVPVDRILVGTDEDGMPKFEKIKPQ